jgi:hypothetical protein
MATQLAVCPTTIYSWAHDGFLREHRYGNEHRCLYEPLKNVTITKGQGGRKATPPIFMTDFNYQTRCSMKPTPYRVVLQYQRLHD